jgi:hypothetical protein
VQTLSVQSPLGLTTIFTLSSMGLSRTWRARSPYLYTPRNRVLHLYPRALGSHFVASYSSQGDSAALCSWGISGALFLGVYRVLHLYPRALGSHFVAPYSSQGDSAALCSWGYKWITLFLGVYRVLHLYPRALGSHFVASYSSQGDSAGVLTPLNTSTTSGGRSVGIFRSRSQATQLVFFFLPCLGSC